MAQNLLDPRNQNEDLKKAIKVGIEDLFPITHAGKTLQVSNVRVEDSLSNTDYPLQKELKLSRKSWEMPIYGDVSVLDSEGKAISSRTGVKIGALPKITNRFSAIIDGNEYQVANQLRRKSGVFSRQKNTGDLQSEFNLAKGSNFTLEIDPEKQIFVLKLRSGTRSYKLWTVLNMLGVTDTEMEKTWGSKKLVDLNRAGSMSTEESDLRDLHKKLLRRVEMPSDLMQVRKNLREYFENTQMDADVNEFTLGSAYGSANGPAILAASRRLLAISRGDEEQDSRDSLIFKKLLTPDDQLIEFFRGHHKTLEQRFKNQLSRRDQAREIVPSGIFSKSIRQFFTTADLSSTPPQTNPVAMVVNSRKTTPMGSGGIQSTHAITMEARDVDPTHIGFIDGLSTPEGQRVGVNLGLASEVEKVDGEITTPALDRDGKAVYKTPLQIYKSTVGLPDQYKRDSKGKPVAVSLEVNAMRSGKPVRVPASEVDFWFRNSGGLFDFHSNLVPFLPNTQGNRGSTAGRMITQALPLDQAEAPLSVSMLREKFVDGVDSYEDLIGKTFLPALEDETTETDGGTVTAVDKDYITIKGNNGKTYKVGLYNEFPLNEDGFFNNTPVVKPGDKVKAQQILAKSNYTDDSGRLALGTNLVVAYIPFKGNSFEDGATITESAAKKLSHTTIHKETLFFNPKLAQFSLKKFKAYYPNDISPANSKKLGSDGLPIVGQTFDPGDVLAAFLVKREMDQLDTSLKKLNKALFTPFGKQVLEWESEDPGVVTEVRKNGPYVDIFIKSVHPFREGDKLCASDSTEFYTDNGWVKLLDLKGSENFLTQNLETGKQRFAPASEINIYDHEGDMYKIEGAGVSQVVSPEHRVLHFKDDRWQLTPAKDLASGRFAYLMRFTETDPVKCQITKIPYSGKIGCPTTEDGIVFIRSNGMTSWTGNSSRYGDKHIVGKIIPDHEAPHRPDGTPVDIMVNPAGVPGRMNVGQLLDTAAGKIALATGKPYEVHNFNSEGEDSSRKILDEMKALGIEPNEKLRDGKDGDYIKNPIFVGNRQYLKLRHLVAKKLSASSMGAYDLDEQPAGDGNQKIGTLETYAYLGHGAKNLLREATTVKGQKNEEYFRRLQFGLPPGVPQRNFMFDKLINYMRGAGVDVEKNGHKMQIMPLSDKRIDALSNGKISEPGMMLQGKNLSAKKGGLFDPEVLGGTQGSKFGHFDLPVRIPNPMAAVAIKSALELTDKQYNALVESDMDGLVSRLKNFNVSSELEKAQADLKNAPVSKVNKLNFRVRILKALDESGENPHDAYTMSKVLVIPPKFRPIIPLPSGDLVPSDLNIHYHQVGLNAKSLGEALKSGVLDEEDKHKYIKGLYDSVGELQGMQEPQIQTGRKFRGALLDLGHTKKGLIFGKGWGKRQDVSGRSTISFEPSLGLDEVGIPFEISKEIFQPFVIKKLVEAGYTASNALKEVKDESKLFRNTLEQVMREKPVLLNRAPSLHKHAVQAFRPKLTDGKDIKLNPLITSGFNVDSDGDLCLNSVIFWAPTALKQRFEDNSNKVELLIDSVEKNSYIYNKVNYNLIHKLMSARHKVELPLKKDGQFYMANLEDFPRTTTHLGKKEDVDFYAAPEGVEVFAYDEKTNSMVLTPVSGWSVHRNKEIWTVTLKNGQQLITDDDPRAVYGIQAGTLTPTRRRPSEASDMLVPVVKSLKSGKNLGFPITEVPGSIEARRMLDKIQLTREVGYFLGALVGDGWYDRRPDGLYVGVNLAGIYKPVTDYYKTCVSTIFKETPTFGIRDMLKSYGKSQKHVLSSSEFAKWVAPLIGKGANKKHLPPFWFQAPREFKLGLLAGLFDTDGSVCVSKSKTKLQLQITYSSINIRLVQEIQQLLRTLGVNSVVSAGKTTVADNISWNLSVSSVEFCKELLGHIELKHEAKVAALANMAARPSPDAPSYQRMDCVPLTKEIGLMFLKRLGAPRDADKETKSLYTIVSRDKELGSTTRMTAKRMIERFPDLDYPKEWLRLVKDEQVTWMTVKEAVNTGIKETGYDLTVPGYETFMSVDGIVLSNTMSVHVPVGYEAEQEARGMYPSQILFKHGDNGLVPSLSQDYAYGIVKLSEIGPNTGKTFKTISDAKEAKIDWTERFILKEAGGKEMTIGQWEINSPLPEKYRDYSRTFTGSTLKKLLEDLARNETSDVFSEVINHYKNIGPMYAFKHGSTVSITDMVFDRSWRDDLISKTEPKIKKLKTDDEKVEAYLGLIDAIQVREGEFFKKNYNNLYDLVDGGALSKSKGGNVRQVLTAPGIVADTRGKAIPIPVFRSYAEGLDILGYQNTLPGVRKGVVDKGVNTQKSGALNKELLSVTRRQLIVAEDCGTSEGLTFPIDDPNLLERYAAETVSGVVARNSLIDGDVLTKAKKKGRKELKARSPLTCEASDGICVKCYGITPNGQPARVGDNVGILDGQALSEFSTQLTLRNFHSGGSVSRGTDIMGAFPRLEQLVKFPENMSGKATLAEEAGTVSSVDVNDIGGWSVVVGKKTYTIEPGRKPVVQVGNKVKRGDRLSDGSIKPQELNELSGILPTQQYLVDELNEVYDKKFNKKTFETVIRAITDTAEITESPEDASSEYLKGDKVRLSKVREENRNRLAVGLEPIKFKSYIKGIATQNIDEDDWFTRITTNRVKDGLAKGIARMQWANFAGKDPIPAYIMGENFGRPERKGNKDGFY